MKAIAFFNNKGGVGKTTLLCNMASYLALNERAKVLIVDADPQCNATQLLMNEYSVYQLYEDQSAFTIYSIVHPLSIGKGYTSSLNPISVEDYGVDLIPGDPRMALKEDLLSKDWQDAVGGGVRGLRTSYLFTELLSRCSDYDFVFFDVGPSLGSINRSVLLACDFFLSPMSIDIFSIRAIENISSAIVEWNKKLKIALTLIEDDTKDDLPSSNTFELKFLGYVAQQYMAKVSRGEKRMVIAYEKIMKRIPKAIKLNFVDKFEGADNNNINYQIGTIPNLFSLIPMSQTAHKPIFNLRARDGVRGAHFNKVKDAEILFGCLVDNMLNNIENLSQ